jgi:hypothetical protein
MSMARRRASLAPLLLIPLSGLAAGCTASASSPEPPRTREEWIEVLPSSDEGSPGPQRPFRVPRFVPPRERGTASRCAQPVEDLTCYCLAGEGMRPCHTAGAVVRVDPGGR